MRRTRREVLTAGLAAGLAACSRPLATRYFGWLLVASATEKAVTVADLSEFRRVMTVPLGETPGQILLAGEKVFVTCPAAKLLVELDKIRFGVRGRFPWWGGLWGR